LVDPERRVEARAMRGLGVRAGLRAVMLASSLLVVPVSANSRSLGFAALRSG